MGASVKEIVIRPLVEADIATVASLEAANQPAPWTPGVFRDELGGENRVYLLAEDHEILGFGGVMIVGDEAHVTNLLVAPPARRRGIGYRLLCSLIEAAIERGARHLTLEVRSQNQAARSLYARAGLAPVGVRKGYYGDDDALILWAHDIDSTRFQERLKELA